MADDVLARLREGSTEVSRGMFTLDAAKARERMREFQLADPRRWIVLLVRAAIMQGAALVEITRNGADLSVAFDGPPLSRGVLENLYGHLFVALDSPEARAHRELALACNAAMALRPTRVVITSGELELTLRPGQTDVVSVTSPPIASTRVRFVGSVRDLVRDTVLGNTAAANDTTILVDACRWSQTPITLDGQPISNTAQLEWGVASLDHPHRGRCGYTPAGAPARVDVLDHGIVLCRRSDPSLPLGLVAAVDGEHLHTDLSRNEPVSDERWVALIAATREAADRALAVAARSLAERLPPWLASEVRACLGRRGLLPRKPTDLLVHELASLPLWKQLDGVIVSSLTAIAALPVRYIDAAGATGEIPPPFATVLVVDDDMATILLRIAPDSVEVSAALLEQRERLRQLALLRARALEEPPAPPEPPEPPVERYVPPPTDRFGAATETEAVLRRRQKFLSRPMVWSVSRPAVAVAPVSHTHEGLVCSVAVLATIERSDARPTAMRVRVLRERRLLVQLQWPCPIPDVDVAVSADDIVPNRDWSGLADEAGRDRILAAVAGALGSLVSSVIERGPQRVGDRRVLAAAACAVARAREELAGSDATIWRALTGGFAALRERLIALPVFASDHALSKVLDAPHLVLPACDAWETALLRGLLEPSAFVVEAPVEQNRPLETSTPESFVATSTNPPIIEAARAPEAAQPTTIDAPQTATTAPPPPRGEPTAPAIEELADDDAPAEPDAPDHAPKTKEAIAELREQRLVRAVALLLAQLTGDDAPWARDPMLARLRIAQLPDDALACVVQDAVVINRRHPVLRRAIASAEPPQVTIDLVVSAVFTALNVWSEPITDHHEKQFIAAHTTAALARTRE